jgi:hypothetical protein
MTLGLMCSAFVFIYHLLLVNMEQGNFTITLTLSSLPKEAEKFFAIFSGLQNQEGLPSESAKRMPIG